MPEPAHDLPARSRNPHLQALNVGDRIELAVEPATHLRTRAPAEEANQVELGEERLQELCASSLEQPRGLLARGQAEGNRRVEREGRVLSGIVVARGLADLHGALLNGVEHLEPRDDLAGGIRADLEASIRHLAHALGQHLRGAVDRVEPARKARDQPP